MEVEVEQNPTNQNQISHITLSCTAERSVVVCDGCNDFTLMTSIKAPFFEEVHRAPIDLVTVIDRSGSMGGDKIELVKETLKFVVRQLKPKDRLSVILYDHEVETTLPLTNMDAPGKEHANSVIRQIAARGSTDLCGGLLTGIGVIKNRVVKNDVASVLLFTDGLANSGIQNIDLIVTELDKQAKSETATGVLPCSVHTFGFGSDHDVNMLKAISDKGSGVYFFIENKDSIADAFADCLGGLLSVVAQNITLDIQGTNGVLINSVRTSYKFTVDNGKFTVTLGDIQSEEERDILCSVSLPQSDTQENCQVMTVKLNYFNVITSKQEESTDNCYLCRNPDVSNCIVDRKVDHQKNRLITAEAITEAKAKGDAGDYKAAREVIEKAMEILRASVTANDEFVKTLLNDLSVSMSGVQDRQTYTSYGGYTMASYSSSHHQQRNTHQTFSYNTSARTTMKSRLDV